MNNSTHPTKNLLLLAAVILAVAPVAHARYSGGDGSPDHPYRIADYNDLYALADDVNDYNKCFVMTGDIDLDPNLPGRRPLTTALIAPDTNSDTGFQGTTFTGAFDGNNHVIRNLTVNPPAYDNAGLFGYVAQTGRILNLGVEDVNVTGEDYVGGLATVNAGEITGCCATGVLSSNGLVGGLAAINYGTITDCYTMAAVGGYSVSGLVGYNCDGTITYCYATGPVSGVGVYGGGLVSHTFYGTITDCYATGDVSIAGELHAYVGGLVGRGYCDSITNCYATGAVTGGGPYVGGLVGYAYGTITDCYATGSVSGTDEVGGLVGRNYKGRIIHSYSTGKPSATVGVVGGLVATKVTGGNYEDTGNFWDTETSETSSSAMGTGKTRHEMQDANTFVGAGWDFVGELSNGADDVWTINEGLDYPIHVWPLVNMVGWYEVDLNDFAAFAAHWQHNCPAPCAAADLIQDDIVNLADYSALAQYWRQTDCNDCGGADLTGDNDVDAEDLYLFTSFWLNRNFDCTADFDFSGRIDELDLAIFSEYWLAGR